MTWPRDAEGEERRKYMRDVYSTYWKDAREKIYGFSDYDRWLCQHVIESAPSRARILEVAIGTGFPLADFLIRNGFAVFGADISRLLLRQCLHRIGGTVVAADAERLGFAKESFEIAYCFHSTWYFPNLLNVLREMNRVIRPGGIVTFDILNFRNREIREGYERNLRSVAGFRALPKRARIFYRRLSGRPTNLHPIVYEVPTDPFLVSDYCQKENKRFKVFAKNGELVGGSGDHTGYESEPRLIFDIAGG